MPHCGTVSVAFERLFRHVFQAMLRHSLDREISLSKGGVERGMTGWHLSRLALFSSLLALSATAAVRAYDGPPPPTADEYVNTVGGDSLLVPPGEFKIDGRKQICGQRPTVTDNKLDDYGAAYPGFLIMNPRLLDRLSPPVKMWIYAHECGHQFRGPDEETADCFAVQRGRRQGWLTEQGLEDVCTFISPAKSDSMHFSGPERCEAMRKCYADPSIR